MTPLDYYLCAGKPQSIDALKDIEAIGEIQLHTIDNVLKNRTDPVCYQLIMASRGNYLNQIIFLINRKDCTLEWYLADPKQLMNFKEIGNMRKKFLYAQIT